MPGTKMGLRGFGVVEACIFMGAAKIGRSVLFFAGKRREGFLGRQGFPGSRLREARSLRGAFILQEWRGRNFRRSSGRGRLETRMELARRVLLFSSLPFILK
jgi:hypothetical protein